MTDDNHKDAEQIRIDKIDAFNKNPDDFLFIDEIICGVLHNPKSVLGITPFIGKCKRSQLNQAKVELNRTIEKAITKMEIDAAIEAQSKILKPGGNKRMGRIFKR